MLPTPRRALVWIGVWFALTAAGWLLPGLIGGKWSEDVDVSLLMAMGGAAIVTYALQAGTFAVEAALFLTRAVVNVAGVAARLPRRLIVGLCAATLTLCILLFVWFGRTNPATP